MTHIQTQTETQSTDDGYPDPASSCSHRHSFGSTCLDRASSYSAQFTSYYHFKYLHWLFAAPLIAVLLRLTISAVEVIHWVIRCFLNN